MPIRRPGTWIPNSCAKNCDDWPRAAGCPKAVICVDLYGQCADYDAILEACAEYGVPLDRGRRRSPAAPPTAARWPDSSASARAFSFNGNKIITTSGGGMLVSDDARAHRTGALPRHPGPRSGAALPASVDRLQLPHEQRPRRHRPRTAPRAARTGRRPAAHFRGLSRTPWRNSPASPSCPRRITASRTGGSPASPSIPTHSAPTATRSSGRSTRATSNRARCGSRYICNRSSPAVPIAAATWQAISSRTACACRAVPR